MQGCLIGGTCLAYMRIFHIVCTNAVHRAWNLFLFSRRLVSLFDCPHFCGLKKKLHWRKGAWIIRTRGSNNSEVPFLAEKVHLLWSFFLAKAVPTGSKSLCTYGYSQYTGLTHLQSDWHAGRASVELDYIYSSARVRPVTKYPQSLWFHPVLFFSFSFEATTIVESC